MKSHKSLSEELGLRQRDLTYLLSISQPLLSMAESGQRSLPGDKLLLIAAMRMHIETLQTEHTAMQSMHLNDKVIGFYKKILLTNRHNYQNTKKRLEAIEKQQRYQKRALELAHYINERPDREKWMNPMIKNLCAIDTKSQPKKYMEWLRLKHKLEMLALEHELIQKNRSALKDAPIFSNKTKS